MNKLHFTKMHGLGNDFILIDCLVKEIPDPFGIAKRLCERKFGIGADQLLLIYPSKAADFKMVIFNADGSEAEMCGNGIRCFARYITDKGISYKSDLAIETKAGIIKTRLREELVEVDMGTPGLEGKDISADLSERIIAHPIMIDGREFKITCVSMGNPHCVIFMDDVDDFPVPTYGPKLENLPIFPERINVEFAQVLNDRNIRLRVWERGSGETMACGTGACATVIAAVLNKLTHKRVTVNLMGGALDILWGEDNRVYMTGPTAKVYEGLLELD